jgi:hypothetical protein
LKFRGLTFFDFSVFESYPQDKNRSAARMFPIYFFEIPVEGVDVFLFSCLATSPRNCACGAVRDPGAKFCPSCGAKLPI